MSERERWTFESSALARSPRDAVCYLHIEEKINIFFLNVIVYNILLIALWKNQKTIRNGLPVIFVDLSINKTNN